jgi:hypothetical protein
MQPMIRASSKPTRASPRRKVTIVKLLAGLSFAVAGLGFLSGSLMAAVLACVSATTLLIADGVAARSRSTQDQLEATLKELVALRVLLTQLGQRGSSQEASDDAQNVVAGNNGYVVPQLSGD